MYSAAFSFYFCIQTDIQCDSHKQVRSSKYQADLLVNLLELNWIHTLFLTLTRCDDPIYSSFAIIFYVLTL